MYLRFKQNTKQLRNHILGKRYKVKNKIPYLRYREIEIYKELISNLKPEKVLEWGAGFSTLQFIKLISANGKWLAIEHDKEWADNLTELNTDNRLEVVYTRPNNTEYTDKHKDGAYEDFKNYVNCPKTRGTFDLISIDGRARNACLLAAKKLLNEKAIVIMHDVNRTYYHEHFHLFKHQVLFLDYRDTAGGIWIASQNTEIKTLLEVEKHQKHWSKYQGIFPKLLSL